MNVDPIYPAIYGLVQNTTNAIEKLDTCMGHTLSNGVYHYHIAPTCLNTSANITKISQQCDNNASCAVGMKTFILTNL